VEGTWLEGSKQFNQQYASSYNYIAYTQADLDTSLASGSDQTGSAPDSQLDPAPTDEPASEASLNDDTNSGTAEAVELYGGAGKDQLLGRAGADHLFGRAGNDRLDGGADNDVLEGGAGADHLFGRAGNDRLDGGAGKDVLKGGAGADVLVGGYGADRFQFQSTEDTAPESPDTISDFVRGVDRIDLRLIDANAEISGDQAFSFINDHGFSGKAGEMNFVDHVLSGDVNGDSIADFALQMNGPVSPADFLV
jgi:Ca2+-binding RTX toxin-like protein